MRPISCISAIFLLCLCGIQGSSAVTPVFVKKGDDVLLNAMEADVPEDFLIVVWKFNKKAVLVSFPPQGKPTVSPAYTGRVEFPVKKFSVKLKNLQEADSGVYTVQVIAQEDQTIAEYNVTVQDPVSPVKLSVDSVSNSSDSCNLTVTCSTQDSHINSTFRCDTKTCIQEGGERAEVTTSGASLGVYLANGSITCNHSNQVSWTKNMTEIQHFCPLHAVLQQQMKTSFSPVLIVILILIPIIIIISLVLYRRKRGKYQTESVENTVYEMHHNPSIHSCCKGLIWYPCKAAGPRETRKSQDHAVAPAQPPDQSPTTDAPGSSPNSVYSLVGQHTGSVGSPPESQYAKIQKPATSQNNSSKNEFLHKVV